MCGIAGLLSNRVDNQQLEHHGNLMLAALRHRGPDSNGKWLNEKLGLLLVHSRLAIQDLTESGHQPMWSHSRRYCIAFNGEIYNFQALAADLRKRGYDFIGHSDTEVLLCAIEEWGLEGALQRSTGMFAFALLDQKEQILHLCRDRLGEKPLYYGWLGDTFCFASELHAIEAITPRHLLEVNGAALEKFIQYGYITPPESIYQGIYKLVPGTILSFVLGNIHDRSDFSPCTGARPTSPRRFWNILDKALDGLGNRIISDSEATDTLDSVLSDTIRRQIIADVHVGVFLSGGIDSSTVAAIAQKVSDRPINTYSIGFDDREYDESGFAAEIAKHIGSDHHTLKLTSRDALDTIPLIPGISDEPFADPSLVPTYLVSRFARDSVKVCLSGDGGDELFAGYNRYIATRRMWNRLSTLPFPVRRITGKLLGIPSPGFWDHAYSALGFSGRDPARKQRLVGLKLQKLAGLMQRRDIMESYDYLLSYWHLPGDVLSMDVSKPHSCDRLELPEGANFIDRAMFLDQTNYLQGDNLTKVDRASMAVSLETRLPLLSHEVVELAWRIPATMKVRDNQSKWVLRQVLYRYVPEQLINRPKMGFSVPVANWLRNDLRDWAGDILAMAGLGPFAFINRRMIQTAWNEHQAGKRDHSQRLWTILMLLAWMQHRNQLFQTETDGKRT